MTDLEMMKKPNEWPAVTYLPLVNRGKTKENMPSCGVLVSGHGSKIYLLNIWDTPKPLSEYETIDFDSLEDLSEAGWEVD